MNHKEAIRLMGAEQYLLNELSAELREQFEEHFFECTECANDVRAGALFLEHSKAILASEAAAPQRETAPSRPEPQSWWAWLRPAVAVPALALLLAVIAYQNWPAHRNPQVLQAALVNIGSRGGSIPSISTRKGEGFLLQVRVFSEANYSPYYSAEVYGPDGKLRWSFALPASQEGPDYFIQVPASSYTEGVYSIAVRGTGADGRSTEIGRSSFDLHIANKD